MFVDKNLHGIERCVFHSIGIENSLSDFSGQITDVEAIKIAFDNEIAGFVFGKGEGLVVDEQRLCHCLVDQLVQILFRGIGVNEELAIAPESVMICIDGDIDVAHIGAAHGFQLAFDEEKLIAVLLMDIHLVVTYTGIGMEQFHYSIDNRSHPSFTFTFNAGPPSLTRTHSL